MSDCEIPVMHHKIKLYESDEANELACIATQALKCIPTASILPAAAILNLTKYMKPNDPRNFLRLNDNFADFGVSNTETIHTGIQRQQYPEYYELFGTNQQQTPDQEYHRMIEKENREWWNWQEERIFYDAYKFPDREHPRVLRPTEAGRVDLYSTLTRDIEKVETVLGKQGISFSLWSKGVTRRALMLFWKMQWNDRPGLEHLCERTETEEMYLKIRHDLFLTEEPDVRGRFIEILRYIARRLWQRLEFRDYTKDWSLTNRRLLRYEQHTRFRNLDDWIRDLTAELTIEVISKIGILRAFRMESAQACTGELAWINEAIIGRFEQLLEGTATVFPIQAPNKVFQFGRAIGLEPLDVVDNGKSMFNDSLWLA
ncbi:MAG: hypothetical protein Q9216_004464 [Gyalolechia sp. 2 TL-2023]